MDIIKTLLKLALLGSSWVMYVLLGLSVLSISAMVERWWFFRKGADEDVDEMGDKLTDLLERGDHDGADALLAASKTIEAAVLRKALRWTHGGPDAFERAVESELQKKRKELDRGMNLLGTLGNNAPFVGLFGTVIGVIEAFAHLGAGQDKAAMANVMSGIAEALVATGVGLFVAIPAVVAYNVFQKKVGEVEDNVGAIANQVGAHLEAVKHVEGPVPRAKSAAKEPAADEGVADAADAGAVLEPRASARAVDPAS
jgi:biopolymer transport protein ExbB/biopolymer transport protein TolQ